MHLTRGNSEITSASYKKKQYEIEKESSILNKKVFSGITPICYLLQHLFPDDNVIGITDDYAHIVIRAKGNKETIFRQIKLPEKGLSQFLSSHIDTWKDDFETGVLFGQEEACQAIVKHLKNTSPSQSNSWNCWKAPNDIETICKNLKLPKETPPFQIMLEKAKSELLEKGFMPFPAAGFLERTLRQYFKPLAVALFGLLILVGSMLTYSILTHFELKKELKSSEDQAKNNWNIVLGKQPFHPALVDVYLQNQIRSLPSGSNENKVSSIMVLKELSRHLPSPKEIPLIINQINLTEKILPTKWLCFRFKKKAVVISPWR